MTNLPSLASIGLGWARDCFDGLFSESRRFYHNIIVISEEPNVFERRRENVCWNA